MKTKYTFLMALGVALTALMLAGAGSAVEAQVAPAACVPGPHSGTITTDETWCLADSPHLMSGDVTVAAGATLTIEPGVTVLAGTNIELKTLGRLQAIGTPTHSPSPSPVRRGTRPGQDWSSTAAPARARGICGT